MRRQTRQRDEVREALGRAPGFVSAQDLHRLLHEQGSSIGLATVYRTLQALGDSGEADALIREGEQVYRACRPGHHHHLVCRDCGAVTEISAQPVEAWAKSVASDHGYTQPEHVVDVFGLCPSCQRSPSGN